MKNSKGYIALCSHFHQPHFQLQNIREQVYHNSYLEWIDFLEKAIKTKGFYINIHFSGPFLYWLKNEKPQAVDRLSSLLKSNKIGLIGGLADESFVQLSTRRDDVLFQMREYSELTREMWGVDASQWQAIHIVERESGEYLIDGLNKATSAIGASPIYYLDSETYYRCHYAMPGSRNDYCQELFGFNDRVSKTTYSHLPDEMLYFCLRDEIAGKPFMCIPIHREHRYKFLKTTPFHSDDSINVDPEQYFHSIKRTLLRAHEMSCKFGKSIDPIVLIFEDAEKFGDWSKNPYADKNWLLRFIELVENDPYTEFTGIKEYVKTVGFLDTYPLSTSHAYAEWENWTAKRGIRGAVSSDERLRRSVSRLHLLEKTLGEIDEAVLNNVDFQFDASLIKKLLLDSDQRFDIVYNAMERLGVDARTYYLVNRIRNIVYQEDSKWASRHPNYGSSPYFDNIGFAYIELAHRALCKLKQELGLPVGEYAEIIDWDGDGLEEVLVFTDSLTVSIDKSGGCINYCHAILDSINTPDQCVELLSEAVRNIGTYHSVHRYAYPLVMTETDSRLTAHFNREGGRKENCRNSFRCDIYAKGDDFYKVCSSDTAEYSVDVEKVDGRFIVCCMATMAASIGGSERKIDIVKRFVFSGRDITVEMIAESDKNINTDLYLVPQIVTSITPSDEISFKPRAHICFTEGKRHSNVTIKSIVAGNGNIYDKMLPINWSGKLGYSYTVNTGNDDNFENNIQYFIQSPCDIPEVKIEPAVGSFYRNYVNDEQCYLGYASSGIAMFPYVQFHRSRAEVVISCHCLTDTADEINCMPIELINHD